MKWQIRVLNRQELPGFRPYLLPETALQIEQSHPAVLAVGATCGKYAVGVAAARLTQESEGMEAQADLTDVFVDPIVRRHGIGTFLLEELEARLQERGITALYADYVFSGENLAALDTLLTRQGFSAPETRSHVFSVSSEQLRTTFALRRAFRPDYRLPASIVPFSSLSSAALANLERASDLPETLSWKLLRDRAQLDLSLAQVRDGTITAYILGGEGTGNSFLLLAALCREGASRIAFLSLLQGQLNQCYYRNGGEFRYCFSTLTPYIETLSRRILTGKVFDVWEEHTRRKNYDHASLCVPSEKGVEIDSSTGNNHVRPVPGCPPEGRDADAGTMGPQN